MQDHYLTQLEIDQQTERYERLCALERSAQLNFCDAFLLISISGAKGQIRDKLAKLQSQLTDHNG